MPRPLPVTANNEALLARIDKLAADVALLRAQLHGFVTVLITLLNAKEDA